jgi:hypothetical protein
MTRRGTYRGVYSSFVDDPDFQRLSPNARLVLFVLRLCKDAGAAAIFRAYPAVIAEQTGLSLDDVERALKELETSPRPDAPWIFRDGPVIWVRNALRYDPNIRLADEKHRKAIERALAALPRCGLTAKFCRYYGIVSPFARPSKGQARPSEDPPRTTLLRDPSTETEAETETETERGVRPSPPNGHGPAHVVRIVDGVREVDL